MSYEFTAHDRLQEPHRYMYTGWFGKPFLEAFFNDRENFVSKNGSGTWEKIEKELKRAFSLQALSYISGGTEDGNDDDTATTRQLSGVVLSLLSGNAEGEQLSRFVRIFEVSKKIYDRYDNAGRPSPGATHLNLRNYALLSIACGLAFRLGSSLKYLNCQLKLNDLLSSCRTRPRGDEFEELLEKAAFVLEEQGVRALMKKSGVSL